MMASLCPAGVGAGEDCDMSALATRGLDGTLPSPLTILCVRDCRLWARGDGPSTDEETAARPCVLLWTGCSWSEVSGASRKTLCTHWIATETQCEHGSFRSHLIFRRLHSRHENAGLRRRRGLSIGGVLELEEADKDGAALGRKKFGGGAGSTLKPPESRRVRTT